jgi:hypothetical protein
MLMAGRPRSSTREFVDDCPAVSVAKLQFLKGQTHQFAEFTAVWPDGEQTRGRIDLATTVPHFGGLRHFYLCPICARKVLKLYWLEEDRQLRCRLCRRLVYEAQYRKSRDAIYYRSLRRLIRAYWDSAL